MEKSIENMDKSYQQQLAKQIGERLIQYSEHHFRQF